MKRELVYLGFDISEDGLKMDLENVRAIIDWPIPNNIFEVRTFHGLVSLYRKFIKNFSSLYAPILETIKEHTQPFKWGVATCMNFKLLKQKITQQPILGMSYFNKYFQVEIDESGVAIGAVLSHEGQPFTYFNENLIDAKKISPHMINSVMR